VPTAAAVERHAYELLARTGAVRWLGTWLVPAVIGDPLPRELLRQLPAAYHPRAMDASMQELRGTVASAEHLLREEARSWGDLPVTVVSAASATAADREAHAALAARSSRGEHVQAGAGGHYVHYSDPDLIADLVRTAAGAA
jgi:CheY-like chemotaxis protein